MAREPQAEAPRELGAGQLAREVHVLQRELKEQVERQAGLLEGQSAPPGAAAPAARRDVRKSCQIAHAVLVTGDSPSSFGTTLGS